ncbi:MAG: hypothetical protein ACFFDT_20385, partial [Candidatus Hodarchaeota archaeon]
YWNGTEVGLNISSVVTVYTPTELIIQRLESDPIPLGTIFNLTVFYNDTVKNLGIPDATTRSYQTDSNWATAPGVLTDKGDGNYNVSLPTSGKTVDYHWIEITLERTNYITQTLNITVLFQEATNLTIYDNNRVVWFSDVFTLSLNYSGFTTGYIPGATVTLNSSITMIDAGNTTYWYEINTTDIGKTGALHYIVNASAGIAYYDQGDTFYFTVNINPTNITATDIAISYNGGTGEYENIDLTNYFADQFSFSLEYNDTHRDLALSTTPSITTNLNVNASVSGTGWLFEVAINGTATQWINITFSEFGYTSQTIVFRITVSTAPAILVGVPVGTVHVTFLTSYDFSIIYRDVAPGHGSVAIPNADVLTTGDIFYIGSVAGTYNFRFNTSLSSTGTFWGDITFTRTGYSSQQTDLIIFQIDPRANTELTGCFASDSSKVLTNETNIYLYFGNDFAFNLTWTDLDLSFNISADLAGAALNGSPVPTFGFQVVKVAKGDYDYRFYASLNSLGSWNITIDLKKFGYVNQTWILYIYADLRPTLLSATLTNGTILPNDTTFDFLTITNINFNLTWIDVNSSASVPLQGAVIDLDPQPAGAVNRTGLTFTVKADLQLSPPYTVNVIIKLNKIGYVPQVFSGSFVITVIGILSSDGFQNLTQYVNETATFTFTMKNQFGSSISDLTISWVLLDTTQSGIASEVETGTGTYKVEIDCSLLDPNEYELQISTEVQNYEPFSKSVFLTVRPKFATILEWDPPTSFTQDQPLTLSVKLRFDNDSESSIPGATLYFTVVLAYEGTPPPTERLSSSSYGLYLIFLENTQTYTRSGVTDSNGIATITIEEKYTKNAIKLVSVQVSYPGTVGNKGYNLSRLEINIPIKPDGENGFDLFLVILLISIAVLIVTGGFLYARRHEKVAAIVSRKETQAYQELLEIGGMRHLFVSTLGGVGIYSETFFEQVTSATSPMLAGLITALDSFVQELSKEETEFSQLTRSGFNMISRRGKYTQLTLISETSATEVTKKRLRAAQNALEAIFEDVLKLSIIDLSQIPNEEIQAIAEQFLHTNLLYGLTVDEEQMVSQWKKLSKFERKAIQAARRAIQLTEHDTIYLNSWVSEMRVLDIPEAEILKAIYAVTKRKLVYVKDWRDIVPHT